MKRRINVPRGIEPTETTRSDGEVVQEHPAFGQIVVTKTSGWTNLYGSDFPHQNYVSIEISESTLHRSLSRDWPFSGKTIIRVSMSEAQWGSMVSSFGVGMGTQCTIDRRIMEDGTFKSMPAIAHRDQATLFKAEGDARIKDVTEQLDLLIKEVSEDISGLSKSKQQVLMSRLVRARSQVANNLEFVANSFGEHLEERVEKAKIEVQAWMSNTIMRHGLESIARDQGQPLQITNAEAGRDDRSGERNPTDDPHDDGGSLETEPLHGRDQTLSVEDGLSREPENLLNDAKRQGGQHGTEDHAQNQDRPGSLRIIRRGRSKPGPVAPGKTSTDIDGA